MKNKKCDIIDSASKLFSNQGIKKTSVDSISNCCGISKKTFYQYFEDKESIVCEIVSNALDEIAKYAKNLHVNSPDAPSELISFFTFLHKNLSVFTPMFMSDILKFYPKINYIILKSRRAEFLPFFIRNIERGISEGFYRKSVNSKLTGELYFRQLDSVLEDASVEVNEKMKILSYINMFFLHGIINSSQVQRLVDIEQNDKCIKTSL